MPGCDSGQSFASPFALPIGRHCREGRPRRSAKMTPGTLPQRGVPRLSLYQGKRVESVPASGVVPLPRYGRVVPGTGGSSGIVLVQEGAVSGRRCRPPFFDSHREVQTE